jgi:hypothetical protein
LQRSTEGQPVHDAHVSLECVASRAKNLEVSCPKLSAIKADAIDSPLPMVLVALWPDTIEREQFRCAATSALLPQCV